MLKILIQRQFYLFSLYFFLQYEYVLYYLLYSIHSKYKSGDLSFLKLVYIYKLSDISNR